jgi:DNA-binding MarR family transcriptional regulator
MNVARKLEKRQLITRPRSRRDARARRLRLTAAGELALAAGRRSMDEIELLFEQALGAARLTELRIVLKNLQDRSL